MWEYNNTDELYHYGVLGMRWGRRKARYTSKDYRRTKNLRKKKVSQMSNKELQEVNKRMELESRYGSLSGNKNLGKKIVKGFSSLVATAGSVAAGYELYRKYGNQIISKVKGN